MQRLRVGERKAPHLLPVEPLSAVEVAGLYVVCMGVVVGLKYVWAGVSKAWYGGEKV
jgi:hypothetical protein